MLVLKGVVFVYDLIWCLNRLTCSAVKVTWMNRMIYSRVACMSEKLAHSTTSYSVAGVQLGKGAVAFDPHAYFEYYSGLIRLDAAFRLC